MTIHQGSKSAIILESRHETGVLWGVFTTYLMDPPSYSYLGVWPLIAVMSKTDKVVVMVRNIVSSAKYRPGQALYEMEMIQFFGGGENKE